jgi:hypothetical protein
MKEKLFGFSLAIMSVLILQKATTSHSWGLVHKMEFGLLAAAVIVLCFPGKVLSGDVPNEFKTFRSA